MGLFRRFMGYGLLVLGLIIIVYSLYSSYNIFTAKTEAPEIFSVKAANSVAPAAENQNIQEQMEQIIQEQLKNILPASSIYGFLNLAAWSVFAGILIFGGAQIAGLGIKLIK